MREQGTAWCAGWPALAFASLLWAAPLAAQQDSLRPRGDSAAARADSALARREPRGDSVRPRPPVSPGTAFLRSLVLPGWGQSTMQRHLTAGLFVTFEGVAVTMVWKSGWQLDYARTRDKYVKSHTQEQQDWVVLLAFNHLFAAAEAFVAANLYDFPVGLRMRTLPSGDVFYGISIPLR